MQADTERGDYRERESVSRAATASAPASGWRKQVSPMCVVFLFCRRLKDIHIYIYLAMPFRIQPEGKVGWLGRGVGRGEGLGEWSWSWLKRKRRECTELQM